MATEILKEWVRETMKIVTSADKAYDYLRQTGRYTPRRIVREVWREVGEKEHWSAVLETWGVERKPPRYWFSTGPKGLEEPYMHVIEVKAMDLRTKEIDTKLVGVLSPELRSFQAAWEEVEEDVSDTLRFKGKVLVGWAPWSLTRRAE
jgi:hypothetical protein